MANFNQFAEAFNQLNCVDFEMFGKHLDDKIFENMIKGDFSDMIKNDNNCEEFKVGYSVETRSYWYQIEFITPKKTTSYDRIIRVYFDADNKMMFLTDEANTNYIINFTSADGFNIRKYEQIDKKIITGFEKATVEELSMPDYSPVPIWETIVGEPKIIPVNIAINDKDGYAIIRNTR